MSKYAKINSENIVENTIVCEDSQVSIFEGTYIKVTDETRNAEIGFEWNTSASKFISLKPFDSWILNENLEWESPLGPVPDIDYPAWDEESGEWFSQTPNPQPRN